MRIESGKDIGNHLVEKVFSASRYAYICSPYISRHYAHKIVALSRSGTAIKVLTSGQAVDGDFLIRPYLNDEAEKDGLPNLKRLVLNARRHGLFHAKLYVADDEFAVAGSANLTDPGMRGNSEVIFLAETGGEVAALKGMFEKFWQQAAESVARARAA
jgi:phosphatidylserine/phosphatidylglycerophosphate/cardiolipin synthase-like enzyme